MHSNGFPMVYNFVAVDSTNDFAKVNKRVRISGPKLLVSSVNLFPVPRYRRTTIM